MPLGPRTLGLIPPEVLQNRGRPGSGHRRGPAVDLPPRAPARRWPVILASMGLHVALFLTVSATLTGVDSAPPPDPSTQDQAGDREIAMVYLDPPETSPPPPPSAPQPERIPEPPKRQASPPSQQELPPPGPERNQVLSPAPAAETEHAEAAPPAARDAADRPAEGEAEERNALSTEALAEAKERAPALAGAAKPGASMEEEARRIFGRPTTGTGNRNNALPWASDSACIPEPVRADTASGPVLDSIMGQVLDGRGQPLVGAHLQIVGTTYHGFSGAGGLYRLVFDVSLVANCRVQVVRVAAPGYRGRDLYLAMGRGSNDVILQR